MKNTIFKRGIACLLLLSILFCFGFLVACEDEEHDDTAVLARAEELIKKAMLFDKLFYIEGLPVKTNYDTMSGYLPVNMDRIGELGYENLAEIIADMRTVWTDTYCTRLENSSLFKQVSTGGAIESKYCYDYYNNQGEYHGIYAAERGLPIQTDPTEYHFDTMKVHERLGDFRVKISVDVTITNHLNTSETVNYTVYLTLARGQEKDAEWLLDSTTAVKFFYYDTQK